MRKFYVAEAVTEGHPDKVCDQICISPYVSLDFEPSGRDAIPIQDTVEPLAVWYNWKESHSGQLKFVCKLPVMKLSLLSAIIK